MFVLIGSVCKHALTSRSEGMPLPQENFENCPPEIELEVILTKNLT